MEFIKLDQSHTASRGRARIWTVSGSKDFFPSWYRSQILKDQSYQQEIKNSEPQNWYADPFSAPELLYETVTSTGVGECRVRDLGSHFGKQEANDWESLRFSLVPTHNTSPRRNKLEIFPSFGSQVPCETVPTPRSYGPWRLKKMGADSWGILLQSRNLKAESGVRTG
jgi:hypothetical protein